MQEGEVSQGMSPTGEQIELSHGNHKAVVVELGAGLREYTIDGRLVVEGYARNEMCPVGRGNILSPWPSRIKNGRYTFLGMKNQLPVVSPEQPYAVHGFVRWEKWAITEVNQSSVVMSHEVLPRPGYPFSLSLQVRYELSDNGLSVKLSATNVGLTECLYGVGFHPYFSAGAQIVDDAYLQVPADSWCDVDESDSQISFHSVEGTLHDFRRLKRIGDSQLRYLAVLKSDSRDGISRIKLYSPQSNRTVTVWADSSLPYALLFTGDPLPVDYRRRAIAIEPFSCPPNAFRQQWQDAILRPQQTHQVFWGIQESIGLSAITPTGDAK